MNYLQGLQQHLEPAQHMVAQPPVALALKQPAAARDLGEGRGLRGERVLPPAERSVGAAHPDLRRREELVHHGAHVQLQGGGVDVARAADLLQRLAAVRVVLRRAGVVEHRHHWKTVGVLGSEASGAAGSFVPETIFFFLSKHAFSLAMFGLGSGSEMEI